MNERRPRFAVVGTGAISQVVHIPILAERADVDLVLLADLDAHKANDVASRFGVHQTGAPEEVLERDDVDAVVVCTPPGHHEEFTTAALRSGKHVLVERPLAMTASGAEHVLTAAREASKLVMVGMPHRFRPEVAALSSFVAGGELGRPVAVTGSWLIRPVPTNRRTWRQERAAGGGALMELGVPAMDLCLWLTGYPTIERLTCHFAPGEDSVESGAFIMAHTECGVAVTVHVTQRYFADRDRRHARVLGTEGSGELPPLEIYKQLGGRPLEMTPRQPRPRGGEDLYTNSYRRQVDRFIRGIGGKSDVDLPDEQVALMRVVEACYRSAEEAGEVTP